MNRIDDRLMPPEARHLAGTEFASGRVELGVFVQRERPDHAVCELSRSQQLHLGIDGGGVRRKTGQNRLRIQKALRASVDQDGRRRHVERRRPERDDQRRDEHREHERQKQLRAIPDDIQQGARIEGSALRGEVLLGNIVHRVQT